MQVPSLEDFEKLRAEFIAYRAHSEERLALLAAKTSRWVRGPEAEALTGLSRTSLWRERYRAGSLIKWKEDQGIKYDYDSLLAHSQALAVQRSSTPLPPAPCATT